MPSKRFAPLAFLALALVLLGCTSFSQPASALNLDQSTQTANIYAGSGASDSVSRTFLHQITRQLSESSYAGSLTVAWSLQGYGISGSVTGSATFPCAGVTVTHRQHTEYCSGSAETISVINDFRRTVTMTNSFNCSSTTEICPGAAKIGYTRSGNNYVLSNSSYCQTLSVSKTVTASASNNFAPSASSDTNSSAVCINVHRPYNYKLELNISSSLSTTIAPNVEYSRIASASLANNDRVDRTRNASVTPADTATYLFVTLLSPSANPQSADAYKARDLGSATLASVEQYIRNNFGSIVSTSSATGSISPNSSQTTSASLNLPADTPTGSKVCVVAAANYTSFNGYVNNGNKIPMANAGEFSAYSGGNPNEKDWHLSNVSCALVVKASRFKVVGGSVFSEGPVRAVSDASSSNGRTYGSWVDYGVISNSSVKNTASGAALLNGSTSGFSSLSLYPMTIANLDVNALGYAAVSHTPLRDRVIYRYTQPSTLRLVSTSLGNVDFSSTVLRFYTSFADASFSTLLSDSPDAAAIGDRYRYTHIGSSSSIRTSTPLAAGVTHIIYSEYDINIASNFTYADGPYTNAKDVPQYLIISGGNIRIASNVTRIDAWLVAAGSVSTCSKQSSTETCEENPIEINGPVLASSVKLNRVANTDSLTGAVSETFTLPASSYLWANVQADAYSRAITTYSRELAPRK